MRSRDDERAGWPGPGSPYHPGERETQARAGVQELAERLGRRMIRDFLPEQHRAFYESLPIVYLGGRDGEGRAWATARSGAPGFVRALDARTLRIDAPSAESDPLDLGVGSPVAVLGLASETRRRNRANGRVAAVDPGGVTIEVRQSFGNCPQYIWRRAPIPVAAAPSTATPEGPTLSPDAVEQVRRADTLFVATVSPGAGGPDPVEGADVSHRGGRPGFVRVEQRDGTTVLTLPDFAGNSAFNTFGNLARDPSAGLLFLDLEDGGVLELTGRAEVLWDGPEVRAFAGAERLLRFRTTGGWRRERALPFRWTAGEPAPQLARTGGWR